MSHITDEINSRVKMTDVLRMYGFDLGRHQRIPCPIHNGKDKNFSYIDEVFHCWTCGAKGNVIGFVMQYFGLTFSQAITRLNNDFDLGLRIGSKPTFRERNDHALNLKMEKVYREYILKKWEKYDELTTLYRILWKQSQRCQIEGLTVYLEELEELLDRMLEGKEE